MVLAEMKPLTATQPLDLQLRRGVARFRSTFGDVPASASVAPGRVNLIGEHTDYNAGWVMPMAIQRQCVIVAAPTDDTTVQVITDATQQPARFDVGQQQEPDGWARYIHGVIAEFAQRNLACGGFRAIIDSTIPVGGGLSSSAALTVATATILERLFGHTMQPRIKAELCQQAEHRAGTPCGIMDPLICTMGQDGHALIIDCQSGDIRPIPFDPEVTLLVIDSGIRHDLSAGHYAHRRQECANAAQALGCKTLRQAELGAEQQLGDRLAHRARHVLTENERVHGAATALEDRDWPTLGRLLFSSHRSLRDDYEVSCSELDALVDTAAGLHDRGVYGARMVGGGFGGCVIVLAVPSRSEEIAERIACDYRTRFGRTPMIFATGAAAGARALDIG